MAAEKEEIKLRETMGRGTDFMLGNGKHYAEIEVERITEDREVEDIVRIRAVGDLAGQELQIIWEDESYKENQRVLQLIQQGAYLVKQKLDDMLRGK